MSKTFQNIFMQLAALTVAALLFPEHYMLAGISTLAWLFIIFISSEFIGGFILVLGGVITEICSIGVISYGIGFIWMVASHVVALYFAWKVLPGFSFGGVGDYVLMCFIMFVVQYFCGSGMTKEE